MFPLQVEDVEEFQDIDVARFVPKEVDDAGITVASADRFTAKSQPATETDGERHNCPFKWCVDSKKKTDVSLSNQLLWVRQQRFCLQSLLYFQAYWSCQPSLGKC